VKIAIDLVGGKLTASEYSHKNGWAYLRKNQLEHLHNQTVDVLHNSESWYDYDLVYLYHGMEFQGSLNLFGGATEANAKFFERLTCDGVAFKSLDIPMPDYGAMCKSRKTCDDYWASVNWDKVSETCANIEFIRHSEITTKLVMGDSHSFSVYQPGYMSVRKDGRTLAGILKKSIRKEIEDNLISVSTLSHLTLYYGNIDVRHHILRNEHPTEYLDSLLCEYENQIKDLNIPNIELVSLLPIESENRKLPKTGYFNGTPFYGTRIQRHMIKEYINSQLEKMCERNNWNFFSWSEEWNQIAPIEFEKTFMERPKSVHLAPKFHRTDYFKKSLNNIITY
jgi:hypothetical protein